MAVGRRPARGGRGCARRCSRSRSRTCSRDSSGRRRYNMFLASFQSREADGFARDRTELEPLGFSHMLDLSNSSLEARKNLASAPRARRPSPSRARSRSSKRAIDNGFLRCRSTPTRFSIENERAGGGPRTISRCDHRAVAKADAMPMAARAPKTGGCPRTRHSLAATQLGFRVGTAVADSGIPARSTKGG